MPNLMTPWGRGPLSPFAAEAAAASETWLAFSTVWSSLSVFACSASKACFAVVLFLLLLLYVCFIIGGQSAEFLPV